MPFGYSYFELFWFGLAYFLEVALALQGRLFEGIFGVVFIYALLKSKRDDDAREKSKTVHQNSFRNRGGLRND